MVNAAGSTPPRHGHRHTVGGGAGQRRPQRAAGSDPSLEMYDPDQGSFQSGSDVAARWAHSATLLPDGCVLIAAPRSQRAQRLLASTPGLQRSPHGSESGPRPAHRHVDVHRQGAARGAGSLGRLNTANPTTDHRSPSPCWRPAARAPDAGEPHASYGRGRPAQRSRRGAGGIDRGTNGDAEGTFWGTSDHRDGTAPRRGSTLEQPARDGPARADHTATVPRRRKISPAVARSAPPDQVLRC